MRVGGGVAGDTLVQTVLFQVEYIETSTRDLRRDCIYLAQDAHNSVIAMVFCVIWCSDGFGDVLGELLLRATIILTRSHIAGFIDDVQSVACFISLCAARKMNE